MEWPRREGFIPRLVTRQHAFEALIRNFFQDRHEETNWQEAVAVGGSAMALPSRLVATDRRRGISRRCGVDRDLTPGFRRRRRATLGSSTMPDSKARRRSAASRG
jgi:hypothetical protein